jgi:hypothetical protein
MAEALTEKKFAVARKIVVEMLGGSDGARPRNLCRDSEPENS